jgi:Ca2+-transporting ATPase
MKRGGRAAVQNDKKAYKGAWYTKETSKIFSELTSHENGLTTQEAKRRLALYGPNKIPDAKTDSYFTIFLHQFQSPLIYILLAACIAIYLTGETVDAAIVLIVLLFNAIVGTLQEGKAQNTLQALKKFTATNATVLRDGKQQVVSDVEVVVGDVIILNEGERVPADARIFLAHNVKVDEASLTGESVPVFKFTHAIKHKNILAAEQRNMVFKGTNVVAGNAKALVVATGLNTGMGKIAEEVSGIDTEMPLKQNIRSLSFALIIVVTILSIALFALGVARGNSISEMFATVVSLSVSVIPEGLPIVITLVLATGVWRMSKRNALVKKLQAVEALGQARIIAVDKTGTLTKNEMVVQKVFSEGKYFTVSGIGYETEGKIYFNKTEIDPANHQELLTAGKIAAFCGGEQPHYSEKDKVWQVIGDPTEAALTVFAKKVGYHKYDLENECPVLSEIPFDFVRKFRATIHKDKRQKVLSVMGAPEVVLRLSTQTLEGGKATRLTNAKRSALEKEFVKLSAQGLRVLAFAKRVVKEDTLHPDKVSALTFGGFIAMKDALRPRVREAVLRARRAGIKVVMITGDNKITAEAIAAEAAIFRKGERILTGQEIESLSDSELVSQLAKVSVFARVTPEHKLRIIRAFKSRNEIVAMTGDGVNDAPSLVAADLGVSMGKIGTEVAKAASDIVLLDDHFDSIVSAVEEGRNIYKTIKKVILYLFSTSLGEVLVITAALILGMPLPVLAAQIIWLNFVTDGFLDVSLAMEPKEPNLLKKKFPKPSKYLVDGIIIQRMLVMAVPMMIGSIYLFRRYYEVDIIKAHTMALTVLAVFQWFNAWNCRSETRSIFTTNPLSNKFLLGATGIVVTLQLFAVYHPLFQKFLHTSPLTLKEWLIILPIAATVIIVEEIRKFIARRFLRGTE